EARSEHLVVVLREGVEAALIVAIVLAYLRRTDRAAYVPYVYAGVGLAAIGSVLGAVALSAPRRSSEAFEGKAMLATAPCRRGLKREIESQVERASASERGAATGVLFFTAVMVLREGVETILFLAATSFTSSGIARLVGALLGLGLAVAFGAFLIRGTLRVDL